MTLSEMIREVWEMAGEPSDLRPTTAGVVDLATTGAQRIRDALNNAARVVSTWKFPQGPRVRFREMEDFVDFTSSFLTDTLPAGQSSPYSIISLPASFGLTDNQYDDWILTVNGASRRVLYNVVITGTNYAYMSSPFPTDPSGLTCTMSRQTYQMSTTGTLGITYAYSPIEVTQVYDLADGGELEIGDQKTKIVEAVIGTPGSYIKVSRGFTFDVAPSEERKYRVYLYRYPVEMTQLTDECELPEAFHEAVILRALWWAYRRMQENADAYSVKRDLDDLLARLRTSIDFESEVHNAMFTFRNR